MAARIAKKNFTIDFTNTDGSRDGATKCSKGMKVSDFVQDGAIAVLNDEVVCGKTELRALDILVATPQSAKAGN